MSIGAILSALAAIPKIMGYIESFASAVTLWYIQRQKAETLSALADAAAFAARAQTDDERYQAAQKWRDVLTNGRAS